MSHLFNELLGRKPIKKAPTKSAKTNQELSQLRKVEKAKYESADEQQAYAIVDDEIVDSSYAHHIVMGEILNSPRFKTRSRYR